MDKITWEVNEKGGNTGKDNIPYVPMQKSNDKMSVSEKEGIRLWNLMRKTLIENNLMEEKD